jgi:hypothetical protein
VARTSRTVGTMAGKEVNKKEKKEHKP